MDERGFTLIELLVVILIIGILAAIALPTFLGMSDKARDSAAKSDLRNAVSQMESCYQPADNYTGCPDAENQIPPGVIAAVPLGGATYTLTQTSSSGTDFTIKLVAGAYAHECTAPGTGGCQDVGTPTGTW